MANLQNLTSEVINNFLTGIGAYCSSVLFAKTF